MHKREKQRSTDSDNVFNIAYCEKKRREPLLSIVYLRRSNLKSGIYLVCRRNRVGSGIVTACKYYYNLLSLHLSQY